MRSTALEQAVTFAREQGQLALWDRSSRPYAIAFYDEGSKRLRALTDEEAAIILTRDPAIAREWRKWNAMTHNQGSLILLDLERVRRLLNEADDNLGGDSDKGTLS